MLPTSMRFAAYNQYGPPEVLRVMTGPLPRRRNDEVLVKVGALSVNGGEPAMRAGKLRPFSGNRFPKRIGVELVGEVADPGSSRFTVGDRVWGTLGRSMGTAAEYVAAPANRLDHMPAGLDMTSAAALPAGTTAITALRDKAVLAPGERLLVRGASGGVGYVAVQLGKAMGAHVTGLASATNLDLVRALGADDAVDYRAPGNLGRFDVIVDAVGTDLAAYRGLLTPHGRMVTITFDTAHPARSLGYVAVNALRRKRWVRFFSGNPGAPLLAELGRLVTSGALHPQVDRVFDLGDIAAAHQALEQGGVRGKIVIEV